MTIWPAQEQANEDMWDEYLRKTSRPSLLEELAAAQPDQEPPAPVESVEPPRRRVRVSETPQPEKDA